MPPTILNAAALPQSVLLIQKLPREKLHLKIQPRIYHHVEPLKKLTQDPSIIMCRASPSTYPVNPGQSYSHQQTYQPPLG